MVHKDILDNDTTFYRCRGNTNVVFATKANKIIRAPIPNGYDLKECMSTEKIELFIKYAEVFQKLVVDINIPKIQEARLSDEIQNYLNENLASHFDTSNQTSEGTSNECNKLSKTHIKQYVGSNVFICDDATKLKIDFSMNKVKTYAIEIKPKQGWKIQEYPNLLELFDMKNDRVNCRYNAMQYTKLKNGRISKISKYCPLDLFSGDPFRMNKAIRSLIKNPQNNFRFFVDGQLKNVEECSLERIIEEHFKNIDVLIDIIIRCLVQTKNKEIRSVINDKKPLEICNPNMILDKNCVLDQVLCLQRLAAEYMHSMKSDISLKQKTYKYLKAMVENERIQSIDDLTPVEKYMIGATMLDCSIMIAFKICKTCEVPSIIPKFNQIILNNKTCVIFEISLLDLDPKPDYHFTKYLKVTNQAYMDAFEYRCNNTNNIK